MNCPAKTRGVVNDDHRQSPNDLAADLTTNSDLVWITNACTQREHRLTEDETHDAMDANSPKQMGGYGIIAHSSAKAKSENTIAVDLYSVSSSSSAVDSSADTPGSWRANCFKVLKTYLKFVGPGMMISVAYIDPGNYATDVQAGASYRFKLLFVVLLSNIFAIFLQSLCIKLGTVTGMTVSQMIRVHWSPWLNYCWLFLSSAAIVATDIAEVIGTAIAITLMSDRKVPLTAGCALCIGDVVFIVAFYRNSKTSVRARRVFEFFVALLVIGVAVSFGIQLSYIEDTTAREVILGFVPSSSLVQQLGLYLACGIVGATVMPHSLILGSGLVQNRLKEFDETNDLVHKESKEDPHLAKAESGPYRPSLHAIRSCIGYSMADNAISLFTFALFVNSAILVVAGSSLNTVAGAADASLFGIYDLLQQNLGGSVAKMFAAALLPSGISAGIVVTMAGQVAFEGHLDRSIEPWQMRLLIRAISVPISMAVAGTLGAHGLDTALVASQVTLCVLLPCISFPLVWFTCQAKYMTVTTDKQGRRTSTTSLCRSNEGGECGIVSSIPVDQTLPPHAQAPQLEAETLSSVNMRNNFITSFFVILIWLFISMMNIAMLVLIGLGKG